MLLLTFLLEIVVLHAIQQRAACAQYINESCFFLGDRSWKDVRNMLLLTPLLTLLRLSSIYYSTVEDIIFFWGCGCINYSIPRPNTKKVQEKSKVQPGDKKI